MIQPVPQEKKDLEAAAVDLCFSVHSAVAEGEGEAEGGQATFHEQAQARGKEALRS